MNKPKAIKVLQMIQEDMKSDTKKRDGMDFNGKNVGAALGEISAAVSALAQISESILENILIEE